eukprot:gene9093-6386_t
MVAKKNICPPPFRMNDENKILTCHFSFPIEFYKIFIVVLFLNKNSTIYHTGNDSNNNIINYHNNRNSKSRNKFSSCFNREVMSKN